MTINELQTNVDQWISTIGVRYFSELTNMTILTEETGELARLIAREYGEQSFKNPEEMINIKDNISDELADIIFVIVCMANQMNINLEEAIQKNLIKKSSRDKRRHLDNNKLKD